ncbi:hypothetical protein K469DRAFT_695272 [Zopfia rhizophila CBS 207.26]|uniref:Uncharacterized protein n=1 Tax=Zopfia rhizophila CBS 207.26 TaxID=1314779 RepID=A0A6A6DKJ6_9PEZI|nr:hypothetical protein K469DRAFT_695272 [Zopfia rhizophila CBS 207.26]
MDTGAWFQESPPTSALSGIFLATAPTPTPTPTYHQVRLQTSASTPAVSHEKTFLCKVKEVFEHMNGYLVDTEVFETSLAGKPGHPVHPVQGKRRRIYTWAEFKVVKFEDTPEYQQEFKKAEGLFQKLQLQDEGWMSQCLTFNPIEAFQKMFYQRQDP